MKNYEVIPLSLGHADYAWCVYEHPTEQVIKSYDFSEDAEKYCKFLNRGGAFDGWTPSFLLREVTVNKNLNQEFNQLLST